MTAFGGEMAAQGFLNQIANGNAPTAYANTSANFKATMSLDQFEQLVKANPALTAANHPMNTNGGLAQPVGTPPNRKLTLKYTVSPPAGGMMADDWNDPNAKGKGKAPAAGGNNPVTCTVVVAEQPDGTWKVDGFTVP